MSLFKDRRRAILGVVTAFLLLLAGGASYRVLALHVGRPTRQAKISRGYLNKHLPLEIGSWMGRDLPLEEAVVRATSADDLVSRTYVWRSGIKAVGVFIAYGVRARDLVPHSPEVCYPGNGWSQESTRQAQLVLPDGRELQYRIYHFGRGGLDVRRTAVLNYYIVDDEYSPDKSLVRSKARLGSSGVRYVAQVQISCPASVAGDTASEEAVINFAAESAVLIRNLFVNNSASPLAGISDR